MSLAVLLIVQIQSGAFTGNGWGAQGQATLTVPLPGVAGVGFNLFARGTYMDTSVNTGGALPTNMTIRNDNFMIGAGLSTLNIRF